MCACVCVCVSVVYMFKCVYECMCMCIHYRREKIIGGKNYRRQKLPAGRNYRRQKLSAASPKNFVLKRILIQFTIFFSFVVFLSNSICYSLIGVLEGNHINGLTANVNVCSWLNFICISLV